MTDEVYAFVVELLERKRPVPGGSDAERRGYRYLDAGHVDSLAIMPFILEIEERFGVELSAEDTQSDGFRTVGGVADLVAAKRAA